MGARIRSALLLGLLTALFLGIGYIFGGTTGMTIGLAIALAMNVISYWYSDKIVLKMYRAKKMNDKEINSIIEKLAKKMDIPKPQTYVIETDVPNAFATGGSPKHSAVAVTRGLLNKLTQEEIEGVLAHELAHIKNRDTLVSTIAATLAGSLTWLAYMFYFDEDSRNPLSFVFLFVLAPLAASIIQMAISRNREYLADHTGALVSNPLKLASALEKISASVKGRPLRGNSSTAHLFIVNPFSGMSLSELFSTHPSTEKRTALLREMVK